MAVRYLGKTPVRRQPRIASNGVIGMTIFVIAETMMFGGLISAFTIVRTTSLVGWPPPGQPRLPIEMTGVNTVALLLSGLLLYLGARAFKVDPDKSKPWILSASLLGAFFVLAQGAEWVALLSEGLTLQSSTHGAFFYVIVGTHGLHAIVALVCLGYIYGLARKGRLTAAALNTTQIFWYFVVLLWPVLYWRVYL